MNKYIEQDTQIDDNFNELEQISFNAYSNAIRIALGEKNHIDFDINKQIEKLEQLLELVTEKNKGEATKLVSEGILDLEFMSNPNINIKSLRLANRLNIKGREGKIMPNKSKIVEKNTTMKLPIEEKYLPIGTVVLLKGGKKKAMITGFCAVKQEEEKEEMWDYSGCLYPEGVLSYDKTLLFDHSQISEIYHLGFSNEEDKAFKEELNKFIEARKSEK